MRAVLVLGLVIVAPAWARAQELPEDLRHVPGGAVGFAHIRAADLWKSPAFKVYRDMLPKMGVDVLSILEDRITPPLSSIDRVTLVFLAPTPKSRGPEFAALIHVTTPLETRKLLAGLKEVTEGQTKFYLLPREGSLQILDKNTLLIGSTEAPVALAQKMKAPAPFAEGLALAASGKKAIVAALNTSIIPPQAMQNAPPMVQALAKAKTLLATIDIAKDTTVELDLRFADGEQARDAERALGDLRQMAKLFIAEGKLTMEKKLAKVEGVVPIYDVEKVGDIVGAALALGMCKRGEDILAGIPVTRKDDHVNVKVVVPEELAGYTASGPVLMALLLPAVAKVREAAARTQDANNLKQMGLAFHIYHDAHRFLPAAICDKAGKPLLSWRVAILPYIEQDNLYKQFKLDEPWDSDHNKKLLPLMPKVYQVVGENPSDSQTHYRVFVGAGKGASALFRDYADKVRFANITDGTSNTILIAEAADMVPWTKPEELTFDPNAPLPRLNQQRRGTNVAFCDGSVRFLANTIGEKTLRALITRDGGEVVNIDGDAGGDADARGAVARPAAAQPKATFEKK
jgi:prepilin-type processing-associated H-X9-DG protein